MAATTDLPDKFNQLMLLNRLTDVCDDLNKLIIFCELYNYAPEIATRARAMKEEFEARANSARKAWKESNE